MSRGGGISKIPRPLRGYDKGLGRDTTLPSIAKKRSWQAQATGLVVGLKEFVLDMGVSENPGFQQNLFESTKISPFRKEHSANPILVHHLHLGLGKPRGAAENQESQADLNMALRRSSQWRRYAFFPDKNRSRCKIWEDFFFTSSHLSKIGTWKKKHVFLLPRKWRDSPKMAVEVDNWWWNTVV